MDEAAAMDEWAAAVPLLLQQEQQQQQQLPEEDRPEQQEEGEQQGVQGEEEQEGERDVEGDVQEEGERDVSTALVLRSSSLSSLDECSQQKICPLLKSSHFAQSFATLSQMRECLELVDVVLVSEDDVEIAAHKLVLAACSPYFRAMFGSFEERQKRRIRIHDIDSQSLTQLVKYAYSGRIEINEKNVQNLLISADLVNMEDVRVACCAFLASQLQPDNCLGIEAFADLHACHDLRAEARAFAEAHFAQVLESDEFLSLSFEELRSLVSSDALVLSTEEVAYDAIMLWTRHDVEHRGPRLAELMEHVRLPLLAKNVLVTKVANEPLFNQFHRCKDYVIEALNYHLCRSEPSLSPSSSLLSSSLLSSKRSQPRLPSCWSSTHQVLLVIGGQAPKAIRSVECFDLTDHHWIPTQDMDTRRCRCGVALVKGKVYAVGGFNGNQRMRSVECYDPSQERWSPMPSMEVRRSTLGVAVLNNKIYAVGGFDGSLGLKSAEMLDLSSNDNASQWQPLPCMSTRRSSVGVGVLANKIVAVGGYDGNSKHCLSSVEQFDPETNIWSRLADMGVRRSGAAVAVLNGLLYSIGGHDGPLVRKSVEYYDPTSNTWRPVSDMNSCRRNAGAISYKGAIYVVGGDDGLTNLCSVEVYNPNSDTWTLLGAGMSIGRSYTGVCVIDKPEHL